MNFLLIMLTVGFIYKFSDIIKAHSEGMIDDVGEKIKSKIQNTIRESTKKIIDEQTEGAKLKIIDQIASTSEEELQANVASSDSWLSTDASFRDRVLYNVDHDPKLVSEYYAREYGVYDRWRKSLDEFIKRDPNYLNYWDSD